MPSSAANLRERVWVLPIVAGVILAFMYASGDTGRYVAGFFTAGVPMLAMLVARRRPNVPKATLTWIAVAMALLLARNWTARLWIKDGPGLTVMGVAALVALLIISFSLISLSWWRNRTGRRPWNFSAAVDAALIAFGGIACILCLLTLPSLADDQFKVMSALTITVVPILDMGVVAAVSYLVLVSRPGLPARWLLMGAVLLLFTFDMLRASSIQAGNMSTPVQANIALALAYGLLGAWALHPSMALMGADQREGFSTQSWSLGRIAVLGVAVMAPVILVGFSPSFDPAYLTVLVVANVLSTALLLLRSVRAVRAYSLAQSALRQQAERDNLTGLSNRTAFRAHVSDLLLMAGTEDKAVSVIYLDLNGFKAVNDTLGHKAGDDLLVEVASRMRSALRDDDFPTRLGGDEFALAFLDFTDGRVGAMLAARMRALFDEPIKLGGHRCPVTAAVGWANSCDVEPPVVGDALVDAADRAMYQAKRSGSVRPARSASARVARNDHDATA